jgi:hypothetical protein
MRLLKSDSRLTSFAVVERLAGMTISEDPRLTSFAVVEHLTGMTALKKRHPALTRFHAIGYRKERATADDGGSTHDNDR